MKIKTVTWDTYVKNQEKKKKVINLADERKKRSGRLSKREADSILKEGRR